MHRNSVNKLHGKSSCVCVCVCFLVSQAVLSYLGGEEKIRKDSTANKQTKLRLECLVLLMKKKTTQSEGEDVLDRRESEEEEEGEGDGKREEFSSSCRCLRPLSHSLRKTNISFISVGKQR